MKKDIVLPSVAVLFIFLIHYLAKIYGWPPVSEFLDSTLLNPITTLIVGFAAYFLYKKQKEDEKRDAANIILLEIESAERQLGVVKENIKKNFLREDLFSPFL